MTKLRKRLGVFSVVTTHEKQLIAEVAAVHKAMFEEPHKLWYDLRHDLFEHLLRVAEAHRVLISQAARDAFVRFVEADGNEMWDEATPKQRRELARKHLDKVDDPELRAAITEVVAQPGDRGLWIETEAEPPPEPEPEVDDGVEVDVNETIRKLDDYVREQDWKDLRRRR